MTSTTESVHLACAACGALNRVPRARLSEDPVCGKCQAALLAGLPLNLTEANFDRVTGRSELPLLVDFWAPWCGPCRAMAPAFEQVAARHKGRAQLVKVDTEANPQLAQRFGIRSIPTLVRLDGGKETRRQSGALPAAQIEAMLG